MFSFCLNLYLCVQHICETTKLYYGFLHSFLTKIKIVKSIKALLLLMVLTLLNTSLVHAQINLVPNPSFESITNCPSSLCGDFDIALTQNWTTPTLATPDYFNLSNGGIPQNIGGYQNARTGNAYVGIAIGKALYREYIQCKLIQPLEADKNYKVTFFISMGDSSGGSCDNMGIYFSTTAISVLNTEHLPYSPQVISEPNNPIIDDIDWIQISGIFRATGGEQYITIGVFTDEANTDWIPISGGAEWAAEQAYYFIDDVSVVEFFAPLAMPTAFSPNGDGINDFYYPVYFDSTIAVREFRVYNRWGQLIHDNPTIGWDGYYKDKPQPVGIYTYYIYADIPLPDNLIQRISFKKESSFTLLR